MRIAVVSSPVTALRPAQLGGAQAFICDLARGLTERGHDVTLHCAEGSQVDGVKLVTVAAPPDAADALVMPGGSQPPPAPGVAAALGQMFQTIRAMDVDVISQHAFDAPALELPRGLRVLHTLHLPPIVTGVVEAARQVPAGALATVSRSCQAHWRGAGVDVERVLPNGVADIAIESAPSRSALIAGRISPEKGIEHAIAAARSAGIAVRLAGAHYDPAYVVDLHGTRYRWIRRHRRRGGQGVARSSVGRDIAQSQRRLRRLRRRPGRQSIRPAAVARRAGPLRGRVDQATLRRHEHA